MKKGTFRRILAFVIALAIGLITPMASIKADAATAKIAKGAKGAKCTCPYCSLGLKKTGKLLDEGSIVSKSNIKKAVKITYKGKSFSSWTIVQKDKVVKYSKKGYKTTIKKGTTKKNVYLPVNRIMRIYIKQSKQTALVEGSTFNVTTFKKKTVVMAQYKKGSDKKLSTYTVSAPTKVKANSKGEFVITVKWGKLKDTIAIPVTKKQVVPNPSVAPSAKPTATPSVAPSTSPSASPSANPSETPSTSPSTSPSVSPSANPSETPSTSPSGSPSVSPSANPSETPSTSPSTPTSPSKPSTKPTASPSSSPSASPSTSPSSSPTSTPEPEKKKFTVTINGGEITRYVGGTIDAKGGVSENTHLYLKAVVPTGQNFVNWTNEKDEVLSYEESYDFYVKGNTTLTANFSRVAVDKEPVVHWTGSSYELYPDIRTVRLFLSIEIPDGYEKQEYGFVYSSDNLSEEQMVIGTAKKVADTSSVTTGSADFTYDARFSQTVWDASEYRYFRPYGIIKDKSGSTRTIYGSIISVQLKMPATE